MPNQFEGVGNLADAPSIKNCISGTGRKFKAAEMRVFFDEYSKNSEDQYEQTGGLWLSVTTYDHNAENCARLLVKGSRVKVEGRLRQFEAHDKDGNPVAVCAVEAQAVYLGMSRVDQVQFSPTKNKSAEMSRPSSRPNSEEYTDFNDEAAEKSF